MNNKTVLQNGQALITLLIFMLIGITVTTTALYLALSNTGNINKTQDGTLAYYAAESGVENALLRLLRDPSYTGENDVPIGDGTVDITVSGTTVKTITSQGSVGNYTRTVQVVADYTNSILTIDSWKEI